MIIFCCHAPLRPEWRGCHGLSQRGMLINIGISPRRMTDRAAPSALSATAGHPPGLGSSLLFLSGSRKKKLTKRKAADYASVATPVVLPAIRHANLPPHGGGFRQVPHFTPSAPPPLHAPDANVGRPRRAAGDSDVTRPPCPHRPTGHCPPRGGGMSSCRDAINRVSTRISCF